MVKMNQHVKYLGQRSFRYFKLLSEHTDKHTHPTECSTWTIKMVGNNQSSTVLTFLVSIPFCHNVASFLASVSAVTGSCRNIMCVSVSLLADACSLHGWSV